MISDPVNTGMVNRKEAVNRVFAAAEVTENYEILQD